MMARKLRQVTDLYVTGQVVELIDGSAVWVQPMNPFQQDTARSEAQIARARMTMALREFGGDEQTRVYEWFVDDGIETARERLVDAKVSEGTNKILERLRDDPEWTERISVMDRGAEATAHPLEPAEEQLLLKITGEFAAELGAAISAEREFQLGEFAGLDEEHLWDAYLTWFIERRGSDVMLAEFRLYQVMFGARWCEGKHIDHDAWDHSECDSHAERLFDNPIEVRESPEDLLTLLYAAAEEVDMTAREAKNSARQGSSSGSSPLPSVEEESTASTPPATPPEPLGTSSSPSPTPSTCLVGAS